MTTARALAGVDFVETKNTRDSVSLDPRPLDENRAFLLTS